MEIEPAGAGAGRAAVCRAPRCRRASPSRLLGSSDPPPTGRPGRALLCSDDHFSSPSLVRKPRLVSLHASPESRRLRHLRTSPLPDSGRMELKPGLSALVTGGASGIGK